jgi:hypothetical protein
MNLNISQQQNLFLVLFKMTHNFFINFRDTQLTILSVEKC